jgi:predicted AlkP superfamily pyrophosphatase or phosphodiesterase
MKIYDNEHRESIPKKVFITLADCDSRLHKTGGTGEGSDDICNYYATQITAVVKKFLKVFPKGNIVVLSDHGMSDVTMGFDVISILKSIAKPSNRTYIYFVDATMLRIWYFDQSIQVRVSNALKEHRELILMSDDNRLKYAIVNKEFGDDIYTVSEDNIMFEPNFYGRQRVNGMHGYIPTFDSQKGVFITNGNCQNTEIRANEVFPILCDVN